MNDNEVAQLIVGLGDESYDRAEPDNLRRSRFRQGWEDGTLRDLVYRDETLRQLSFPDFAGHLSK